MPSSDSGTGDGAASDGGSGDGAAICHVERTDDAAVMRWVCNDPPVGRDGPRQAPEGVLATVEVWAEGNALLVRSPIGGWAEIDRAVREALGARAEWLCVGGAERPSLAAVRQLIESSTRSLTELHGGGIEVVAIEGQNVHVRMAGECHGCRFTNDTLRRLAQPAIARRFPGLVLTVVE